MNVLVAESKLFSREAEERLRTLGEVRLMDLERQDLLTELSDCDVLWVRLRNRIDREVMDAATALKFIITPTTGLNHIDLEEAKRRGIAVLSLRGEVDFLTNIRATAEHTLALTLALLRNLRYAAEHVEDGGWSRDLFRGEELLGRTVGVVGYGRLGRITAEYFHAFGSDIIASDPCISKGSFSSFVKPLDLDALLGESDIVTLHVNLSAVTAGFFGRVQFARMKQGSRLINTSRGELLDEAALLGALRSGHLAGAALDVLCDEDTRGMPNHPLVLYAKENRNLLLTPHIGGCTYESMERTECFMAEKLIRYSALR